MTQGHLKDRLDYEPLTGEFTWLQPNSRKMKVGDPAGTKAYTLGGHRIRIDGHKYFSHRLAWIYTYGDIPEGYNVHHIDKDVSNNRISNLELTTQSQSCMTKLDMTNRSSENERNIYVTPIGHYEVYVNRGPGDRTYYGIAKTIEEARVLRREAEIEHDYMGMI